jgi:hypothetical protein
VCEIPSYKKEHLYHLYVLEVGRLRHVLGDRTKREILEHWISEKMSVLLAALFVIRFIIKYTCFVICSYTTLRCATTVQYRRLHSTAAVLAILFYELVTTTR